MRSTQTRAVEVVTRSHGWQRIAPGVRMNPTSGPRCFGAESLTSLPPISYYRQPPRRSLQPTRHLRGVGRPGSRPPPRKTEGPPETRVRQTAQAITIGWAPPPNSIHRSIHTDPTAVNQRCSHGVAQRPHPYPPATSAFQSRDGRGPQERPPRPVLAPEPRPSRSRSRERSRPVRR